VLLGGGDWRGTDVQIVRLESGGRVRWSASLYDDRLVDGYGISALQSTADGGALVGFGTGIARLGARGERLWWREKPARWIAQAGHVVALSDCDAVSLLDADDGRLLWQRGAHGTDCYPEGGVAADASGNVYALLAPEDGSAGFRIVRYGADGQPAWTRNVGDYQRYSLVGPGAGLLYVLAATSRSDLLAIRTTDGSSAWTRMGVDSALLSGDAAHEPLASTSGLLQRLAGNDGHVVWTSTIAPVHAAIVGNAVVGATPEGLVAIDASTGASDWMTPALAVADPYALLASGGLLQGRFSVVYQSPDPWNTTPVQLFATELAGGMASEVNVQPVAQGVIATSVLDEGGDVVGAAVARDAAGTVLEVRRTYLDSGDSAWETAEAIHGVDAGLAPITQPPAMATGSGEVVAALAENDRAQFDYPYREGAVQVSVRDLETGSSRWSVYLRDDDQLYSEMPSVAITPAGDVAVATGSVVGCPQTFDQGCARQSVYMLSALDGSVRWRHDEDAFIGVYSAVPVYPAQFKLVGTDVVLSSELESPSKLLRLDGGDGHVLWSNVPFGSGWVFSLGDLADPRHLILDAASVDSSAARAAIDLGSGSIAWRNAITRDPYRGCAPVSVATSQGYSLASGIRDDIPLLRRYENDGSGAVQEWPLASSNPSLRGCIEDLQPDPSGNLRVLVRRYDPDTHNEALFLVMVDPATGPLPGEQAISGHGGDGGGDEAVPDVIGTAASDRILVDSRFTIEATSPTTDSVALIDAGATARGDLGVQLELDRLDAGPGETVEFRLTATYVGDRPIQSARAALGFAWEGGVTGVACEEHLASHCTLDTRSGNVQAQFDVEPGGSVEIHGEAIVTPSGLYAPYTAAVVFGPPGLVEQDSGDNFARAIEGAREQWGYASFRAPVPFDGRMQEAWRRLEGARDGSAGAGR
jgi:hypothetical protein